MSKILTPKDEAELAKMVARANKNKTRLRIEGGGTRQDLGNLIKTDATLSLKNISGITLYEPGALTLVAKAGTPLKEIEKALKKHSQRLAFEPMDHRAIFGSKGEPTIGAIVAGNISGSRRIIAGGCRDSLIGVRFINGNGEIIKNGGRVMKNVTGLDLVKLMAGSFGTLGVISEVSFKLLPVAQRKVSLEIKGLSSEQAISIMSKALGSPFEITAAAHLPKNLNNKNGDAKTLLRIEGFDSQVDYRIEKLSELIANNIEITTIEGKEHDKLWRYIRNVKIFKNSKNPLWKLSIKPSDAPDIEKQLIDKTGADMFFDWAGGLIWLQMQDEDNAHADVVRHIVKQFGGHATLVRASDEIREAVEIFQPEQVGIAKLSNLIRKKFDPSGILNPNLMGNLGDENAN